jgi:hypothetical protein
MRVKRWLAAITVPLLAALGLWFGLGAGAAARPHRAPAGASRAAVKVVTVSHRTKAIKAKHATAALGESATDPDNLQSGDQSAPDSSASESESESESEGDTTNETDNVDCQQQGEFQGVNAAGTGPGCDGSGT